MARYDGERRGQSTVCYRYACISWNGNSRRDSWHNFKIYMSFVQRCGLFATTAEDERIAAF